jgi:hypothetical protein
VCKEEERAVIGKQTPALLFEEDKPEPLPPFIPAYLPDFPARHSYKTTNVSLHLFDLWICGIMMICSNMQ